MFYIKCADGIADPQVNERQTTISITCPAASTGTSHASVHHALQEHQLYPYHIQSMQELVLQDAPARRAFCQWILQHSAKDPTFIAKAFHG